MASNAMTWPRERRSGSIETKPGAAPGEDLHGGDPGARGAASSAPARPASRPGPRSGRPRARVFRLLPVLALLLAVLAPFAAAPAAAAVLVSNDGQTANTNTQRDWWLFGVYAQGFTTGSNTGGYTLTSIEANLYNPSGTNVATEFENLKVELWSDSNGDAGSKLADLTKPTSYTAGKLTFTAPAGTTLSASTTYHVVFYTSPRGTGNLRLRSTSSANEDSGAATGWSIGNTGRVINNASSVSGTWTGVSQGYSLRMVVNGSTASQSSAPGAPTGLTVTPGNAQLSVSWTAPSGTVTGYDVHYTSNTSVAAGATVQAGAASVGWKAVSRSGTTASQTISSLMNGTPYRVRVRAKNTNGDSAWVEKGGTPRSLPTGTIWSGMLTAKALSGSRNGCNNNLAGSKCSSTSVLTDNDFTLSGTSWEITYLSGSNSELSVDFNRDVRTALDSYSFCVGTTAFAFSDAVHTAFGVANNNSAQWSTTAANWNVGDTPSLSIGTSCAQQTRSTNANLSGLTAGSSTSSTGTLTNFSIGTFGATTTTYTASVANDQTHVKLTPTVDDTGKATVGVRKGTSGAFTPVTSGSASGAIALTVGANTLVVRVTAEDTTTTKDYTVTVTRRAAQTLSTNADLSGLTAGSATSSTGTFTNFSIGTFGATTTTYTASVANDRTHVKLTPTVADTGATVTVAGNAVNSGSASGPIALSVGSNAITVRVTAEDTTTTKDYTVTVTRQAAGSTPTTTAFSGTMTVGDGGSWKGFRATPSVGQFTPTDFTYGGVGFRILGLRVTNSGYLDLHLNKAPDRNWGLVLNVGGIEFRFADAALFTGPGYEGVIAGWGYANQGETPPSWSVGDTVSMSLGEPASAAVKLSVRPNPVREGSPVSVEACLLDGDGNRAVPQGTARIPVTLSHGTSEDGDWGVSQSGHKDGRLPISTAHFIAIGGASQRSCGVVNIPTHRDSDSDDETFTVALAANLPPGVEAGTPASVAVTIQDLQDWPEVSLRAVRRAVAEGSPVELQAVLAKALATDVAIPLRVRRVTSERTDHGFIRSITIAAGATSGSGTIRTHRDDDTDDERFQVAVVQPDLPAGVAPGTPSTVGITIVDGANARLRALDLSGN